MIVKEIGAKEILRGRYATIQVLRPDGGMDTYTIIDNYDGTLTINYGGARQPDGESGGIGALAVVPGSTNEIRVAGIDRRGLFGEKKYSRKQLKEREGC